MTSSRILRGGGVAALTSALWAWSASAHADSIWNMTHGVTDISRNVYDLHMLILWICVFIGIGVFGVMFWSIYHHRKSRGAEPAQFHESTAVEVAWTVVPMVILISMAVPATQVLIRMADASEAELTIKVTGYQWLWHYEYLDEDVAFFSALSTPHDQIYGDAPKGEHYLLEVDNPLVVPAGTKIRFVFTSADVIHSWWVPALGWKQDTIPGFINENWTLIEKPGTYRGQCAELCGRGHAFMPIIVEAVSPTEFQEWLARMKGQDAPEAPTAQTDSPALTLAGDQPL
jgi:cytochrome c oxidase subunit II